MDTDRFSYASSSNLPFIEERFKEYCQDPANVAPTWRHFFEGMDFSEEMLGQKGLFEDKAFRVLHAFRTYGHRYAKVNPLFAPPSLDEGMLSLKNLGITEVDLSLKVRAPSFFGNEDVPLSSLIEALQDAYCSNIGVEYMSLERPDIERWVQERLEGKKGAAGLSLDDKRMILEHLNRSEIFESFLQTKYVGQKRFSLEGGEALIPMIAALLEEGASSGMQECVIGMAHRGRLNVLANILNKAYDVIFHEFQTGHLPGSFEGSGDVKYHKGFSSEVSTRHSGKVKVSLVANPSHLESVDPVVTGVVRGLQEAGGTAFVIPLLIHGDASLSGQGVVYETQQFSRLPGYSVGGTIHIVVNNQVGFTASPQEGRSTRYCTDLAKAFEAPIFHVNGEDPEGCVFAVRQAVAFRNTFHSDVFIDLVCYRKYGHNESDEPAFTQPEEYKIIRKKPPVRDLYVETLIRQGVLERAVAMELQGTFRQHLQEALEGSKKYEVTPPAREAIYGSRSKAPRATINWKLPVSTQVSLAVLQEIATSLATVPEGFTPHRKIESLAKERLSMLQGDLQAPTLDWGMAENLAFGSLLMEGVDIRLSGQDSGRGTFSHRHAIWKNFETAESYLPLCHLRENQGHFYVYNSPLSEFAVLGFEYGYSLSCPEALVLWEAQFGDFSNGAQVIIDQYVTSAEQKWGTNSSLVMLLPHGYEGQGPEHSSARIERFLQLTGEENLFVVNPTTPAQYFHILRRQKISDYSKPLIVMTPKGLLRHPRCLSAPKELIEGRFHEILKDSSDFHTATRVLLCSGRVYYDLEEAREKSRQVVAILRVEQLYPFHAEALKEALLEIKGVKEIVWVQEEPSNMGAWDYISPLLRKILPQGATLHLIARPRSASPATGSFAWHQHETSMMMQGAFGELA